MRFPSILISLAIVGCANNEPAGDGEVSGGTVGGLTVDDDGDGYTDNEGDCDDSNANTFPGAAERCDGQDNDCDGNVDEDVQGVWYIDNDSDGWGSTSGVFPSCNPPPGFVSSSTDCDDTDASANPGETEVCDGVDNDCDASVDEGVTSTYYADADSDGFGDATSPTDDCSAPVGYVIDATDCDDTTAAAYPGALEVCDSIDNDCDAVIDQVDDDGDGWISATCAGGADCDDADAAINPGAADAWYDGIDSDCEGNSDFDQDNDGYDSDAYAGSDCADQDPAISPGATEIWYDGIDQNCDAANDYDQDADGFTATAHGGSDCDDVAAGTYPGAVDAWYDGVDANCDGASDFDQDADGYDHDGYGGQDCDDTSASVQPSATEVAGDNIDNNCDDSPAGSGVWRDLSVASADATFLGESAGDRLGLGDPGIDGAGDVNGDGIGDIIIGAYRDDDGGSNAGAAYVVFGPVSGTMSAGAADAKIRGESADDMAGARVAGVGDMNNDGYDDVAIGVIGDDAGGANAGAAYLVYGPMSGSFSMASADAEITGAAAGDLFGEVAWIGDVSGDGYDDVMVGSQYSSAGGPLAGSAYIIHGPLNSDISASAADAVITGETFFDESASSNWGAGDVNGDGINDLLIGARNNDEGGNNAGAAYVVLGPVTSDLSLAAADSEFTGESAEAQIGWGVSISTLGDTNNDGYDDIGVGAKFDSDNGQWAGAVYAIFGPPASGTSSLGSSDAKLMGEAARDFTGDSVHGPGDVDGDGFDDLLVGSGYNDGGALNAGAVYLVRGPFSGTQSLSTAAEARFTGSGIGDRLRGHGAGDVDGDGRADVLVSAQLNDAAGEDAGAAYLFFGSGL